MKHPLRLLLVWLMLLALPFQGIAAAAMRTCTHQEMAPHGMAAVASPQGDVAQDHCHEHAAQDATTGTAVLDQPHDAAQHGDDGRCSACAACCMGAVLAPAPALLDAAPGAPALFDAAGAGRLAEVDLALPERPPRSSLA